MNTPPRILVADDSPTQLMQVASLLKIRGEFSVTSVVNGREALELCRQEPPDLLLSDLQMPEMDGFELLKIVQSEFPTVPVVIMTGVGSEEIAARALALGAASYVPKVCLAELLLPTIQRLLAMREGYRESRAVRYFSCFISHSHHDQEFCDRLYTSLRDRSIQLWYSPKDMRAGERIDRQVQKAILEYDKLLVVLSLNSLSSDWVITEILRAKDREAESGRQVLFPIRLVGYDALKSWSLIDADTGRDVAREIRSYFIPDFSDWNHDKVFEDSLMRLVTNLEAGLPN